MLYFFHALHDIKWTGIEASEKQIDPHLHKAQ